MALRGRSSAAITTILVFVILHIYKTQATTYTVGDASGWSFNCQSWTHSKTFKAGDTLVFNYDPSMHNVAVVDANSYNSCTSPSNSKIYSSGNDSVKLSKGKNYFICSIPGHCDGGLKLSVNASSSFNLRNI